MRDLEHYWLNLTDFVTFLAFFAFLYL